MNAQISAIAKYFGIETYTIDQSSGIVGNMRFKLARYEDSVVIFKYPHKSNPYKKTLETHQHEVLETLDGLFTCKQKDFLRKYSVTHYVAVDKKKDNKVVFYTTYTAKKDEKFPLGIKVFGREQFHDVNFTIVSDGDTFYITDRSGTPAHGLKEFFLLQNCRYEIKKMFGNIEELNKDLIDMCFI